MEDRYRNDVAVQVPHVLLPKKGTDYYKWAVVACDQFTSEPEYWNEVEQTVGDAPSTLNLTFPEVYLEMSGGEERIQNIQTTMKKYLDAGVFEARDGFIYVERTVAGKTRKGIVLALDLERYDYNKGSSSLIRATEGTIVDRLPPRMKIREGAALEFPHILVLIDDPNRTVIEPLMAAKSKLENIYDFDLMLDSGHLAGYAVSGVFENQVVEALRGLAQPETFAAKYGIGADQPVLLFAMGDGNHSLATAKAIWEKIKSQVGMDHPARYALVEIENVHDEGLEFEPIHRVLFGLKQDMYAALESAFGANYSYTPVASAEEMVKAVDNASGEKQAIGLVGGGKQFGVCRDRPPVVQSARWHHPGLPRSVRQEWRRREDRLRPRPGRDRAPGLAAWQRGHLPAWHVQVRPVQDGHPRRRIAAQDFLDGRGARKALLHGSAQDSVI